MSRHHCKRCGAFVSAPSGPGSVAAAVESAIGAADWLTDADAGSLQLLRELAAAFDRKNTAGAAPLPGMDPGGGAGAPDLAYPAQILLRILAALLLTPEARNVDPDPETPEDDLISRLRSAAQMS